MNKKKKSSKNWLTRQKNDEFVKKAHELGYRSRSAFKLLELQQKDKLIKPGFSIVDIGAAPGGWSQVAANLTGKNGYVLAIDILPIEKLNYVDIIEGDFSSDATYQQLLTKLDNQKIAGVDIVLSDIAPNISGIRAVDEANAVYLAELALSFAIDVLKPGGSFVVKVFHGRDFENYLKTVKQHFLRVAIRKPKSSRQESKEVYIVAREYSKKNVDNDAKRGM